MKISKRDQKQIIRRQLKSYFDDFNFVFEDGTADRDTFTLMTKWGMIGISLDYKTSGRHYFSKVYISHFNVEQIIVELGLPNHDFFFETQIKGLFFDNGFLTHKQTLVTVRKGIQFKRLIRSKIIANRSSNTWSSKAGLSQKSYSYLPNVLTEMNRLEVQGKYWNGVRGEGGLLDGGSSSFFSGIDSLKTVQ